VGELAGSLGDLGTFVPIAVGMVQIVGLDAATLLVFAGLASIAAGLVFRIPMAVQPMKAIGALAIAGMLTASQVGVAGLTVGAVLLLMGALGLIGRLDRIIPRPVLRGLQMTVAIHLVLTGARMGLRLPGASAVRPLLGPEGLLVVGGALALLLLLRRRLPLLALGLVALGLLGAALKQPGLLDSSGVTLWRPKLAAFGSASLSGIWLGGLSQVPLTLLNSVFAVAVLAGGLFPEHKTRNSPRKIALSVGLMNVISCPFGAMPVCHGSGGLAGQYRFGARSGLSMAILGSVKLIIGLLFGLMALAWMRAFPSSILSVFLLVAGLGLASASKCWQVGGGLVAAIVMVAVHVSTGILVLAFACGWIAYALVCKLHGGSLVENVRRRIIGGRYTEGRNE
jgi:MFS superfamily sulfate permease-like transporter